MSAVPLGSINIAGNDAQTRMSFANIHSSYAFFREHSTEETACIGAMARLLRGYCLKGVMRLMDVGCSDGGYLASFLKMLGSEIGIKQVALQLVEPDLVSLRQCAARLAGPAVSLLGAARGVEHVAVRNLDLVLCNHVLYFVQDLEDTLQQMYAALRPGGKLLLSISRPDNAFIDLWRFGFGTSSIPFLMYEDLVSALLRLGYSYRSTNAEAFCRFPDCATNRRRILEFTFGTHLTSVEKHVDLDKFFNMHRRNGEIHLVLHDEVFMVEKPL